MCTTPSLARALLPKGSAADPTATSPTCRMTKPTVTTQGSQNNQNQNQAALTPRKRKFNGTAHKRLASAASVTTNTKHSYIQTMHPQHERESSIGSSRSQRRRYRHLYSCFPRARGGPQQTILRTEPYRQLQTEKIVRHHGVGFRLRNKQHNTLRHHKKAQIPHSLRKIFPFNHFRCSTNPYRAGPGVLHLFVNLLRPAVH
jgi:hypothetical protein